MGYRDSEIEINLVPFNDLKGSAAAYFADHEIPGYRSVGGRSVPKNVRAHFGGFTDIFWGFEEQPNSTRIEVDLRDNFIFAKHFYSRMLFNHFQATSFLTNKNFIADTEVWVSENRDTDKTKLFRRFTLKIADPRFSEGPGILLSYDGISHIAKKPLSELGALNESSLNKVVFGNKLAKYEFLSPEEKANRDQIFPILNRRLESILGISTEKVYVPNKYLGYREKIKGFYQANLSAKKIGDNISITSSGFLRLNPNLLRFASEDSNLLTFGGNNTHYNTYYGLKQYGPVSVPDPAGVEFIFIFNSEDRDQANTLFSYLKKGFKGFPGIEPFIGLPLKVDPGKTIRFTSENPIQEISEKLESLTLEPNRKYLAFYLSRIEKDDEDEEKSSIYFKVKETLLQKNITSQVISSAKIASPNFNYFLPNICVAVLSKLGGVPWRLYRPVKNDLVIGIGAYKPFGSDKYIGNAFCFKNDGVFQEFDAFLSDDVRSLGNSFFHVIKKFKDQQTAERLVIHFYKLMSKAEERQLIKTLTELNIDIPYVIVTVNDTESKDYVIFDVDFDGLMPKSGTILKIKNGEYLLCNNTRYAKQTGAKIESFPFPIKVKITKSNYGKINEEDVILELIDQVYQFSRMYWKSVRQRNKPATIEYSEIVADMVAHLPSRTLPSTTTSKNSLWFL